jgi:hypothetical protein
MATTCPFTGYRQVDFFDPDEEYLSDDEEFYVTLDLGTVEPTLLPSSSTYRLVVSIRPHILYALLQGKKGLGYAYAISAAFWLLLQGSA